MDQQPLKKIDNYVYDPIKPIGKGSFATVYQATNELNGAPAALKVIPTKLLLEDEEHYNLFVRELNVLRQIQGEHIVGFFDVKRTQNNLYIVTEYCNDGDLEKRIKDKKIFTESEACSILKQIANAFITVENSSIMNDQQQKVTIMHRDIKPANILFHNGRVKVADFGFAKVVEDVEKNTKKQHTPYMGTPLYMAPEILNDEVYSSKCDIWSTGMVFYQMLFGKFPWTGFSIPNLYTKIKKTPLEIPQAANENIKDLLNKMLKVDEEDRISWRELYTHPALQNIDISQVKPNSKEGSRLQNVDLPPQNAVSYNAFRSVKSEEFIGDKNSIPEDQTVVKNSSLFIWGALGLLLLLIFTKILSPNEKHKL